MNERTVLQLRISYLQHNLRKLPNGWIGTYNNRAVVIINFDPDKPQINNHSRRRYLLSSKKGVFYNGKLEERVITEAQLNSLLVVWRKDYEGDPEIISFPLMKNRFCGIQTNQFMESAPNQNKYKAKNPIPYKGQILRSKNELLAIKQIEEMGFIWKTEICFRFGKYTFCPDVVFYVPYIDKPIALELDGMMDADDFYEHAEERRHKYIRAGFEENKDVIFLRINNEYDFPIEDLKTLIETAIERSIADLRIGDTSGITIV